MKKILRYGILLDSQSRSFGFKTTERGRSAERIRLVFSRLRAAGGIIHYQKYFKDLMTQEEHPQSKSKLMHKQK
jgi:hypothetical protein